MKHLLIFLISLVFISSVFSSEYKNFGKWLSYEKFNIKIKNIQNNQYLVAIEAKPLLGDGVVFRVKLNRKPSSELKYDYIFGKDKKAFDIKNKQLAKVGYKLNSYQVVQLQDFKSHQAVWVLKNNDKKIMKTHNQLFKERYKKYDELLLLFPKSPFVIKNRNLVVLENNAISNLEKQKAIINLALKSIKGMSIPDGCKVVIQEEKNISVVTFENKLPENLRGGDYIAEIKINNKEMKVMQILVGS